MVPDSGFDGSCMWKAFLVTSVEFEWKGTVPVSVPEKRFRRFWSFVVPGKTVPTVPVSGSVPEGVLLQFSAKLAAKLAILHFSYEGRSGHTAPPPPELTLEYASPSPPQGSIWHRFDIDFLIFGVQETVLLVNHALALGTPAIFVIFVVSRGSSSKALVLLVRTQIRHFRRFRQKPPFSGGTKP